MTLRVKSGREVCDFVQQEQLLRIYKAKINGCFSGKGAKALQLSSPILLLEGTGSDCMRVQDDEPHVLTVLRWLAHR